MSTPTNNHPKLSPMPIESSQSPLGPALIGLLLVALVTVVLWGLIATQSKKYIARHTTPDALYLTDDILWRTAFSTVDLEAHAYIVYDIKAQKILAERQAYAPRPLASLTKLMTALVAIEQADLDTTITLSKEAIAETGDDGLLTGEAWRLDDLIQYMLITSSNDASFEIAETVAHDTDDFVDKMNRRAKELGFDTLVFRNPSGLDIEGPTPSAFGSAYDIARLMSFTLHEYPSIFLASSYDNVEYRSLVNESHVAENTNVRVAQLPALVVSKTGYTIATGGNLSFIFEAGPARPLAVVILGSTFEGRFDDAEKITNKILEVMPVTRE
jgi:D-alanyl-D-alanine carboxypeptidase